MPTIKHQMTPIAFRSYLDHFAEKVKSKDCQWIKVPYESWKQLIDKTKTCNDYMDIRYIQETGNIAIRPEPVEYLDTFDGSIGEYLLRVLFPEEAEHIYYADTGESMTNSNFIKYDATSYWDTISTAVSSKNSDQAITACYSDSTSKTTTSIHDIEERLKNLEVSIPASYTGEHKVNTTIKEKNEMKFNFDFGPCTGNTNIRMSPYGLAIKNKAGTWVSYDTKHNSVIDVDIFNFDGAKFLFKVPVAIKDVKIGDMVIHNAFPMYVKDVCKDCTALTVVDPVAGEEKTILPTKSMFGFDFITKVVNLFDGMLTDATADAPFGSMLPFMVLAGDGKDIDPMTVMMMMSYGKGNMDFMSNPMMMFMLMGDKSNKNDMMLPMMFMMNNQKKVESK